MVAIVPNWSKSTGQHAFGDHVSEAHRANHFLSFLAAYRNPQRLEAGLSSLLHRQSVYPAKTHTFMLPLLVGLVVDDSCYPTCQPAVFVGQMSFGLTKLRVMHDSSFSSKFSSSSRKTGRGASYLVSFHSS